MYQYNYLRQRYCSDEAFDSDSASFFRQRSWVDRPLCLDRPCYKHLCLFRVCKVLFVILCRLSVTQVRLSMEFHTRHVINLLDATGVFSFVTGRFRCRPQNAKCEAALHNKICFTIVPRFESRHARAVIRVTYVWSELHIYS